MINGACILPRTDRRTTFKKVFIRKVFRGVWLGLGVLSISAMGVAQANRQNGTLVVAGHSGQAPIIQIDGRPYVPIDALARLMNGSLGYQGDQITLTLPGVTSAASASPSQPPSRAFSAAFLNSGIETVSDIREWRSALLVAVQNGYRVTDGWMGSYQAQASKNLHLASVAATTDADRSALPLLTKEFGHMQQLENKVVAAKANVSYITADSLKKDPLDQKILKCAHSLGEMAASGEFRDDGSCH